MSNVSRVVMFTVEYAGNDPKGKCTHGGSILEEKDRSREETLAFAALTPSAIPYCWNVPLSGVNRH